MKGADAEASGHGATTVYRDKKGRKLDMLNEFMRQQDAKAGKEVSGWLVGWLVDCSKCYILFIYKLLFWL